MILRKPYKFLIKNFKLIHFILSVISIYLLIKTNIILSFFNSYLKASETIIASGTSSEYFNGLMTLFTIIMLLGTIIILIIMKMKDKPIIFYIINIITYVIVGIVYAYDSSIIQQLEISVLDIRTIKLASDFTLICFMIQTLNTIILVIRAIGFDVKKFNFGEDLKLEISEKDNEEFEFELDIDENKLRRNINKNIRNIKYIYHENKFIYNIVMVLFIVLVIVLIYLNFEVFNKVYKKNETINTIEYTYSLLDSYLVNQDYRENIVTDNYLVVTKLKIKNNTNKKIIFETGRLQLHIGKTIYNPITTYKDSLIDLGETYINDEIKNEYVEYIITFEIPKSYINKKMYLRYTDINNKKYNIKLKNEKFEDKQKMSAKLNEYIKLNDKIYKNIKFKISKYEINNKIKATYSFCETKTNCYESYEYIYPKLTDNYNKVVLKIESDIDFNDQNIKYFNDLSDFIENYGTIKYKFDNDEKEMKTKIKEIEPVKSNKKGVYYFEVYDDIKDATQVSLILTIRNKKYEYILK